MLFAVEKVRFTIGERLKRQLRNQDRHHQQQAQWRKSSWNPTAAEQRKQSGMLRCYLRAMSRGANKRISSSCAGRWLIRSAVRWFNWSTELLTMPTGQVWHDWVWKQKRFSSRTFRSLRTVKCQNVAVSCQERWNTASLCQGQSWWIFLRQKITHEPWRIDLFLIWICYKKQLSH